MTSETTGRVFRANAASNPSLFAGVTSHHSAPLSIATIPSDRGIGSPAFTITCAAEMDRRTVLLAGELDLAAARSLEESCHALVADGPPVVIDCSGLTFIDCSGIRAILRALDSPDIRLANVPAHMSRLLRITGLSDVVQNRTRFEVAVAIGAGFDSACAEQVVSVFARANSEGCSYDVTWIPLDVTAPASRVGDRRFHCLVVPPLDRWLGLSAQTAVVRRIGDLAARTDRLVGVGTGLAVLAAAGLLDGHRIALRDAEPGFAALTPRSALCNST